ncbi:MAG TPA: enoyl-CoA hydratase [Mycobacteriales bacterium]
MSAPVLLSERDGRVATVTLNRPDQRNALSAELIGALRATMRELQDDDGVDVVVLTGADPAFCAGLDLKELGSSGKNVSLGGHDDAAPSWAPWPPLSKPVIGAVNGVAVTGGLELALACDILIASERARFADTHARVGILPGWGLSVLLPLVVGRGLARRMSLTGDYVTADDALRAGLVTQVVAHEDLLPTAHTVAASIVGNDQPAVRRLLRSYRDIEAEQVGAGYDVEARTSREWMSGFDPARVESRRRGILDRGRTQTGVDGPGR